MFENRCPVCNNELIDTAYGRLCFNPGCDVFDEYMLFEEKEGAQSRCNNLNIVYSRAGRKALRQKPYRSSLLREH